MTMKNRSQTVYPIRPLGLRGPLAGAACLLTGLVLASAAPRYGAAQTAPVVVPQQVQAVLTKHCASAGCHGNTAPQKGINVLKAATLARMIDPAKPETSKLLEVLESGYMPLGAPKLSDAEIQGVRDWLKAGSRPAAQPEPKPETRRAFVPERAVLDAILSDLNAAPERERPYLRYFSLANLSNNPELDEKELERYRSTLSKLMNHLSWEREIVVPTTLGTQGLVLRIDLRRFAWNSELWQRVIAAYPYGVIPRDLSGPVRQIQALSGATLPYLRVDWFVANASVPPLYHDLLQLPDNVPELERKLGVNARQNVAQERVVRAGVRNSGVSVSNRGMERHPSPYGAYWVSFDYADNRGHKNLFADPVDVHPDGGEFVFHLPNGLQGYFIATAEGKRLDVAPINIVRDKTNFLDPEVRTGRSCIGCHFQGMKGFTDEVEPILRTQLKAHFDLDQAQALYPGQKIVDALLKRDSEQFLTALRATGSPVPQSDQEEPINRLAQLYGAEVSVAQAAADAFLPDVKQFQRLLQRSSELEKAGFGQLQGDTGGIKRDLWEENFGSVVEELRLGTYLKPSQFRHPLTEHSQRDARPTVSVGVLTGPEPQVQQLRQALIFWLNQSNDVRVVGRDGDYHLKGTLLVKESGQVVVQVGDPKWNILVSTPGASQDTQFLAQQIANQANFAISGSWLPIRGSGSDGLTTAPQPLASELTPAVPLHGIGSDPVQELIRQIGTGGPIRLFLSVDRGPGSTYQGGEDVGVGFRADRDCYVTVYNVDSAGRVALLFPNQHVPDNRVRANQVLSLADPKDGSSLIQVDPNGTFGIERLVAFATETPVPLLGVSGGRGQIGEVAKSLAEFRSKTLKVKEDAPSREPRSGGASSALIQFFTVRR